MKKLFKLKKWLTLEESARHLSTLFDEAVTVADVLRLGLDGRLTISVDFINRSDARLGKIVPAKDLPVQKVRGLGGDLQPNQTELLLRDGVLIEDVERVNDETLFVQFEPEIVSIVGIWDLPMRGGERIDIENRFQSLTGGPRVDLVNTSGSFAVLADGTWASLQERLYDGKTNEFAGKIATRDGGHYPREGLPDDCVLVVRTEALRDFEKTTLDVDSLHDAPYFDADSDDYPLLLHIAVRAWQSAKEFPLGTPKQRVMAYLDKHHSEMAQGTRDAIAQVVNWQRTGGRPAKKNETVG